jgi:hypothetical protein
MGSQTADGKATAPAPTLNGSADDDFFLVHNCFRMLYIYRGESTAAETLTYRTDSDDFPACHDFQKLTRGPSRLDVSVRGLPVAGPGRPHLTPYLLPCSWPSASPTAR